MGINIDLSYQFFCILNGDLTIALEEVGLGVWLDGGGQ